MIRRPKTYGKFMVAVFLLWQVVAVVHLAIALHTLCPDHGAVAHTDCSTGKLHHHGDQPFASDECFVLVALAANGGMPPLDVPFAEPPEEYLLEAFEIRSESVVLQQRYRFRLSPSQSPPTVST